MGFEQLAALRAQLANRAEAQPEDPARPVKASPTSRTAHPLPRPAKTPVDPVLAAIRRLQRRFPSTFPRQPAPNVPLKVGILADLLLHAKALSMSEATLHEALGRWCHGQRY